MNCFYLYTFENNMYNVQNSVIGEGKTVKNFQRKNSVLIGI